MQQDQQNPDRFLSEVEVLARTGLSSNTIRNLEKAGKFPSRRKVSLRAVRWLQSEISQWMKDPEGWEWGTRA